MKSGGKIQALAPDSHTDAPREFFSHKDRNKRPTPRRVRSNTEPATNTVSGILVPQGENFSGAVLALRELEITEWDCLHTETLLSPKPDSEVVLMVPSVCGRPVT